MALQRLKERKLFQWTLAYLAGAWLVLEVFDTLQGGLGWPSGLFPILLALLVVGFLVTLVLAWYHGEQGRQRVSGAELLIIAGLLLVAGMLTSRFLTSNDSTTDREVVSVGPDSSTSHDAASGATIAVLPFGNRSGLDEDRPFVDGIHDEILTQLAKIHSLQLTSLTSVMPYRESLKTARAIGEELGARYIVEGSVQRVGTTVLIRVSLVEAALDRRVWGADYDRDLTVAGLLDIQRGIALQVAAGLGAEVLPAEADLLDVAAPENRAAYERYLEGLSHLRSITLSEGDQIRAYDGAITSFGDAILAEPDWAPPRASLGTVRHWMASRGVEPSVNYPRSLAALDAALEIDSLHGPAWESLGFVRHYWERDFSGADEAYRRARDLGSRTGWTRAILLMSLARFDEAISEFDRHIALDPLSPLVRYQLGMTHVCAASYDSAIEAPSRKGSRSDAVLPIPRRRGMFSRQFKEVDHEMGDVQYRGTSHVSVPARGVRAGRQHQTTRG